jgi:hypothetical protein
MKTSLIQVVRFVFLMLALVPTAQLSAFDVSSHLTNNTSSTIYYQWFLDAGTGWVNRFGSGGYATLAAGATVDRNLVQLNSGDKWYFNYGYSSTTMTSYMELYTDGSTLYTATGSDTDIGWEVHPTVYMTYSGGMTEGGYPPSESLVAKVEIHRTGSTSSSRTVYLAEGGTAIFSPSFDWSLQERVSPYSYIGSSTTIPAGSSWIELWMIAWNDGYSDPNETASLSIAPDTSGTPYAVGSPSATPTYTIAQP